MHATIRWAGQLRSDPALTRQDGDDHGVRDSLLILLPLSLRRCEGAWRSGVSVEVGRVRVRRLHQQHAFGSTEKVSFTYPGRKIIKHDDKSITVDVKDHVAGTLSPVEIQPGEGNPRCPSHRERKIRFAVLQRIAGALLPAFREMLRFLNPKWLMPLLSALCMQTKS